LVRALSPRPKILANSERIVAAPGAIGTQPRRPQWLIARSEPLHLRMTGYAKFKSLGKVDSNAPGVLHANPAPRPGVQGLRNILAEQERGVVKEVDPAQQGAAERTQLHRP